MNIKAIILAAGKGLRMHSSSPKVLHRLMGRPMLEYSINVVNRVTGLKPLIVIGYGADAVRSTFKESADFIIQDQQLGTAHALLQAEPLLRGKTDYILVTYGDMPLLTENTLNSLVQTQVSHTGPVTFLTFSADESRGFGRVVRDDCGRILSIVEENQASPEQLILKEMNVGVYCFLAGWLWEFLHSVPLSPKGEYYLTDLISIAVKRDYSVKTVLLENPIEAIGINTRVHLAEAENYLRNQINHQWMEAGVTLIDPDRTYIEPGVSIGADTIIWPDTYLQGSTSIGEGCTLGPNSIIFNTTIGDNCKIISSNLEGAVVENNVDIGPFGHLRNGAHLARGVHMGNFGEVKSSYLGPGSKMGHFSYIGDAQIGEDVNIGAGTITCNFDGEKKSQTRIEANAFIGSDTMLVAPVTIGEGARTGAGAVVTKDVPPYTQAVGVPARSIRRLKKSD